MLRPWSYSAGFAKGEEGLGEEGRSMNYEGGKRQARDLSSEKAASVAAGFEN
jgi:hypothetical protein